MRKRTKVGVTRIEWTAVACVKTNMTSEEIAEQNTQLVPRKNRLCLMDWWNRVRGQEELLEEHECCTVEQQVAKESCNTDRDQCAAGAQGCQVQD